MVTRKPYRDAVNSTLRSTPRYVAMLMLLGLPFAITNHKPGESASLHTPAGGNAPAISEAQLSGPIFQGQNQSVPNIISQADSERYRIIFRAQKKGDWAKADEAIGELSNRLLLGHVLAARYQSHSYDSSPDELAGWLNRYADHPQAPAIRDLALAKDPSLKKSLPFIGNDATLNGYGDDNGPAMQAADSPYARQWQAGLDAWRHARKAEAAQQFAAMAAHSDELSPWAASAAAYWASRAYRSSGEPGLADRYLRQAAEEPRSFYGILARRQLHQSLGLDLTPLALNDEDILELIGDPVMQRVIALSQSGQSELAERELRAIFPQTDAKEKPRLLALAQALNLASVQISMASQLSRDGKELDVARYPIPDWQPNGGFSIDPALIYAMARQESGFRASAVSPGGALGIMQLMPQTALLMQKQISGPLGNAAEPVLNMTLGQDYVHHLLDNDAVEGNLFYLLAAYNAGPGRLQAWKESIIDRNDPLLFVESIPYAQTRHYVMQVMTNYWIYSELAGNPSRSVHSVMRGHWPAYDNTNAPVAARASSGPVS